MSFNASVYCVVSCLYNICTLHIARDSRVCIHLGVHEHPVSNGTYRESLDMTYQCVANEVIKTPTAKNSAIIMAAIKKFLADYFLEPP